MILLLLLLLLLLMVSMLMLQRSAVEAAEQQNAKRLKSGMLDSRDGSPELQHTHSQTTPLPRHYYDEPDPAK